MRSVRVLAVAAEEAAEAAAWYEAACPGLGFDFERAVAAALELLGLSIVPLTAVSGTAKSHGVKRLVLRRFPYDIIVVEHEDVLIVLAFAHHARRPAYWRGRLRS
jgi:toxin ParE1/3/4